jgi:hypothetical protein
MFTPKFFFFFHLKSGRISVTIGHMLLSLPHHFRLLSLYWDQ